MGVFRFALIASAAAGILAAAPGRDADVSGVRAAMEKLPLRFEANQGQWAPAARFVAHATNYTLLVTPTGPVFTMRDNQRVDLSLVGSNPAAEIVGSARTAGRHNYMVGDRKRWRADVPAYSRVVYREAYPGIDAAYYGTAGMLEYDFIVAPGADPSAIRMRFHGAKATRINSNGELIVETAAGDIVQKRPVVYQESGAAPRTLVAGEYRMLADGAVGFALGRYDRSKTLVIDPLLTFSRYYGSSAVDEINAVKVGPDGKVYVVGNTTTSEMQVVDPDHAYSKTNADANNNFSDIYAMILRPTSEGTLVDEYATYLGGTHNDVPTALDVDSTGMFFITGYTTSSDYPDAGLTLKDQTLGSTYNAFVTVLYPAGSGITTLWYSTRLGGTEKDWGRAISYGRDGLIYVYGSTTSPDFPVTANAYQSVLWGPQDTFITKIDMTSATPLYSTYLGGENADEARSMVVGPSGLVYFAATTTSTTFPWESAPYRNTLQGKTDIVIGVMDTTKSLTESLLYASYFGGSDVDEVRKIALDSNGRLVLTGFTLSADFPITLDAMQSAPSGNGDAFLSIVDPRPGPFLVYSTFIGGSGTDVGYDLACDTAGSVYLTGYTMSPDFPVTSDAPQTEYGKGADVFVMKMRPGTPGKAALQFGTYIGGLGNHVPTGIALGANGMVYVVGYSGLGMPAAGSSVGWYVGGVSDGFVLAISGLAGQTVNPDAPRAIMRGTRRPQAPISR